MHDVFNSHASQTPQTAQTAETAEQPAPAAPPLAVYAPDSAAPYPQPQTAAPAAASKQGTKGKKTGIIAALVILAAAVIAGAVYFITNSDSDNNDAYVVESRGSRAEREEEREPENSRENEEKPDPPAENTAAPVVLSASEIFENSKEAVFQIFTNDGVSYGWGSGFFINETGVAITNHHVMAGVIEAKAVLFDGREFNITGYYTYDADNDWTVIQVGSGGGRFDYINIGDPKTVKVGDNVFALGGPDGDPITLTTGIVSRLVNEPLTYGSYTVSGLIQFTAPIYAGSSGGPLLNDYGQAIAINSGGRTDLEAYQWAVPVNRVDIPGSAASVNPLPVSPRESVYAGGQITMLREYPFIPDIQSVTPNAELLVSGDADFFDYDPYIVIDGKTYVCEYMYLYELPSAHFASDTNAYDDVLEDYGFVYRGSIQVDDSESSSEYYFYHSGRDITLFYNMFFEYDGLAVYIYTGDLYAAKNSGGEQQQQTEDLQELHRRLIIGTWLYEDGSFYFEFKADGTCRLYSGDDFEYKLYWETDSDGDLWTGWDLDDYSDWDLYIIDKLTDAELVFTALDSDFEPMYTDSYIRVN